MKKIKIAIAAFLSVIAIISPFVSVLSLALFLPSQFDESFVGALDEKVELLAATEEEKIVIIGGSSVAFGYDSSIIEKYAEMPVINFGLYAALGTKLMLDLSRPHIKAGDVVIIAPELDAQTLSLYFNSDATLRALDGSPSLYRYVDSEHYFSLLGASWGFLSDKIRYMMGASPEYSGVYNSKSFGERGDITYPRPENTMSLYYDPNTEITLTSDILSSDFVEYLNGYIEELRKVGADVYFEFCPMNSLAVRSSEEEISAFAEYLKENINCTFIGSIRDYIYDPAYFYDTNFHLNSAGAVMHTVNVTRDLLLELSIPKAVVDTVPAPPPLPEADVRFFDDDENARYFTYEKLTDGSYMITGILPEYKNMTELTLPLGYDTYKVSAIGKSAFSGSSLKKLVIPENTNINFIANGAFLGASSLSEMWIYYPHEEKIMPPVDFVGTASDFVVYVPEGSTYSLGYYWSERGLKFEFIK
ncbi:MAG: hypothetical protein J6Q68_03775 [Clostridia bacterium]|nr:hypothetical protein [Clostridia bacterium]